MPRLPYTCDRKNCTFQVTIKKKYDLHIRKHIREEKSFLCEKEKIDHHCDIFFKTEKKRIEHYRIVHKEGPLLVCDHIMEDGTVCGVKVRYNMKDHKKTHLKHSFYCDYIDKETGEKCTFSCPAINRLTSHKKTHNDIRNFICKETDNKTGEKCKKTFTTNRSLLTHYNKFHKPDAIVYTCELCGEYKTTDKNNFNRHKASVHEINTVYVHCDIEDCDYKCKNNQNLNTHKEYIHDIGKYPCDFCLNNRNSKNMYNDTKGKHHICNSCYKKATGNNTRVETIASEYLDEHFGTDYLLGSDKSLKSMGACTKYRPDKFYTSKDLILQIEIDEHQHKYSNSSYNCEEKRLSDIYGEISGKKYICIRWNPHKYKPPHSSPNLKRELRLSLLVKLMKYLIDNPPKKLISVYYMFYDLNNPQIVKSFPKKMIYSEKDFISIDFDDDPFSTNKLNMNELEIQLTKKSSGKKINIKSPSKLELQLTKKSPGKKIKIKRKSPGIK